MSKSKLENENLMAVVF